MYGRNVRTHSTERVISELKEITEDIGVDAYERKLDRDHLQVTLERLLNRRKALNEGTESGGGASQGVTADRIASAKKVEVEVSGKKKTRKKKSG